MILTGDGDFDGTGDGDINDPDQAVYPEEVDKTVQSTEDEYPVEDHDASSDTDPTVSGYNAPGSVTDGTGSAADLDSVDVLDDPEDDASPGATASDDRPGLLWIRRAAPGSHLVLGDHDGNPATPDTLGRVTFANEADEIVEDLGATPPVRGVDAVEATDPTKSEVAAAFVDVSRPYWVVDPGLRCTPDSA